jgi:alpha-galactosidase
MKGRDFRRDGRHVFAENDAKQWAAWGIDYLKYDWNPRSAPQVDFAPFDKQIRDMTDALRNSGRDIVYSYSNSMQIGEIGKVRHMLNAWRTSGDIRDNWERMSGFGFGLDRWAPYQSPGHWNDPDMMVVGYTAGWGGRAPKPTALTPDEQYTHVTLWCMVSAPLLLGCDLERMDEFTLNLLTNDEVLAVSQDALGQQGKTVSREGTDDELRVYVKELSDGSKAVGLFNLGNEAAAVTARWSDLKITEQQTVRDLWRQKDIGQFDSQFRMTVAPHGAELISVRPVAAQ